MRESIYSKKNLEEELINDSNQIDFGSIFQILIQRKKIFILLCLTFFIILTSNLIYKRVKKPIYRGSFTLMISDPFLNTVKQNNSIEDLALNKEILDIPTLVQYLKSPGVVSNIAKINNLSPIYLANQINISIPRNTGSLSTFLSKTLLISLEGENKFKTKKILKELSREYILNATESRNQKLSEGIKFLNNEKPKLLSRVRESQEDLENFRLENRIINPIKEGEKLTDLIEFNQNKILTLKSENVRLLFIKQNLINGILYTEGINQSSGSNNNAGLGVISSDQLLLKEILEVKSQLANAQSKYKQTSIIVKNLKEKLNQLEPILLKNQKSAVEAAIIVNKSLIKSYENQLDELKEKFIKIPSNVTKFSTIIQELKSLEKNLQSLNETKDKLVLELSQGTLPWKIIKEPFVSSSPVKPEIKRNLVYIILSTLFLAGFITYLLDKLDNVFHHPAEVEKYINLPTLGFVPYLDLEKEDSNDIEKKITINDFLEGEKGYNSGSLKFIFEETFRNIYTSIKFSKTNKEIKIINITSTIPEEGKSLCSLFLAMNIAQISKKVLILDTDLRKPSLHKRIEVDNVVGLSNYLVNDDNDWRKYVNEHKVVKNLSYITAGTIPPNPITLIESAKMKSFIDQIKKSNEYDFIILDCTPLLGLSDAVIISNYVDAIVLTISLNKVNKNLTRESTKKLALIEKPVIGTIINSVSKEITNEFIGNKYNSYGNPYNYYSYKYMPIETQNRYLSDKDKLNPEKDIKKYSFNKEKFIEKLKITFKNFKKWLNE